MDAALLKQRDAFLKKAAAQPSVSSRKQQQSAEKRTIYQEDAEIKALQRKLKKPRTSVKSSSDFKNITPCMSVNFGILAKIVDHMKKRHLEQEPWSLTLEEILEEISMFDLPSKTRQWLLEVLPRNPRLALDDEAKFVYKPPHKLGNKNPRSVLLRILKKHDLDGKGGILLSDLADSVANPEKLVEKLGDAVIIVPTTVNKRKDKVLYYNDPECAVTVDEDFKHLWRSVAVDHLDEKKIEDYLHKHGIDSMRDLAPKKATAIAPKRKAIRKKPVILHNEHLDEGILKDYSLSS